MKRNLLVPGEDYAYSESKYEKPRQVKILSLKHEFATMKYGREIGTHWGVRGRFADADEAQEVTARFILHPWEVQQRLNAFEEAEARMKATREADREAAQVREIAAMHALVPQAAWEGLVFAPGNTPHLSVKALTRLLKAARTQALAEATEPFPAPATKKRVRNV